MVDHNFAPLHHSSISKLGQSYYKQFQLYEQVKLGESRGLALFGWGRIVELYDVLLPVEPSAVVELVRAAAMAMWDGPFAGMESIDAKGSFLKIGRGDETPLELFRRGVRTLAPQLSFAEQALVAMLDSSRSEQPSLK